MANTMTGGMRSIVVDKIASVTQACGLSHEVRVSADIPAEEGVVVAVVVLFFLSFFFSFVLFCGCLVFVGFGVFVVGAL